ncbi:MAG: hypothetical protein GY899_03860 [Verrucomicrobiaceae bacterium]|nr:hypothetical protein [Verrucomicrobiaceae bacterium]
MNEFKGLSLSMEAQGGNFRLMPKPIIGTSPKQPVTTGTAQPAIDPYAFTKAMEEASIKRGKRLSVAADILYLLAIIASFIVPYFAWGFAELLVIIGLLLNIIAIIKGATSKGIWGILAGLIPVQILILLATIGGGSLWLWGIINAAG